MPRFSVIMPIHNAERTLPEAVRSVLDQTERDLELIAVDNGSTDRSREILAGIDDPRLVVLSEPDPAGPAAALNRGLERARGELLAFHDADDRWHPSKLGAHRWHLDDRPGVAASYSYSRFLSASGVRLPLLQKPRLTEVTPADVLCRYPISNGSNAVWRRSVLETTGLLDASLGRAYDVEYWFRATARDGFLLEGVPRVLTYYRLSPASVSSGTESKNEDFRRMLASARRYAPEWVDRYGARAMAFHLRFTARREIADRNPRAALRWMRWALAEDPSILLLEPRRTLATALAAAALACVPRLRRG